MFFLKRGVMVLIVPLANRKVQLCVFKERQEQHSGNMGQHFENTKYDRNNYLPVQLSPETLHLLNVIKFEG